MGLRKRKTDKQHVLLVVRHPVGGIRTYLRYVMNHMQWDRYYFTIVVPAVSEVEVLQRDLAALNTEFVFCGTPVVDLFKTAFRYTMRWRVDLIHSHGFFSLGVSVPGAWLTRTPHLATLHDALGPRNFRSKAWLKRRLMYFLFKRLDKVQFVSDSSKELFLQCLPRLGHYPDKLVCIPSGVELTPFKNARAFDLKSELSLPAQTRLVGYLGRFMSLKGFKYLIDALAILKQRGTENMPHVVTYGGGGFIREDRAYLRERGLEPYFHFMPFSENVPDILKSIDVLVMPSLSEACGLLAIECLIAGTPLIASTCVGLRDVIKETPATGVPVADAKALADAIMALDDSHVRAALEYREQAARRFDVRRTAEQTDALYQSLLARKK